MANILGFLGVELGLNTAAFKGGCDKATYAAKQFTGDLKKSFSELGSSFSELGAQLGASFGPVGGIISGVTQGIGALSKAAASVGGNVPGILQLAGATVGLAGAAAAAVAGYAALAVGGAHAIEELSRMSEKTGISIRDLQTLKAVGQSVDVPLESMARGFRTFSRALVEGGDGSSRASIALHNLGVTAHDPYQALLQVADGISKIEDPSKRSADATALFGSRIGLSLLPVLEKGSSGIKEYGDLVDVFGAKIDKDMVNKTEAWKKSTVELSTAWDNLKISASGMLPVISTSTDFIAKYVAAWAKGEKATDWLKDVGSLLSTGHISTDVTQKDYAQDHAGDDAAAKEHAASVQKQQDSDKLRSSQEALFNLQKEGGAAGAALKKAELEVSRAVADEDYEGATAIQKTIPALREAADLEKKRSEALLNLPKTTKSAIDEQAVTMLKSYGEAIKGLGPASSEAARQQEVAATVQKFYNKQVEEGIAGTPQAKAALAQYTAAVNEASLANTDFGKSAEVGKMLSEFSDKMKESSEKAKALGEATSQIGRANAELSFGLDKAEKALAAEGAAYNAMLAALGPNNDEVKKAFDLLVMHTQALNVDKQALLDNQEATDKKISDEALTKQGKALQQELAYTAALKTEPEWQARAEAAALAEAQAIGLSGEALAKFLALKKEQAQASHDVKPMEEAQQKVQGPAMEMNDLEAQKKFLTDNAAEWQKNSITAAAYARELNNIILKEQQLKAEGGSMMAGVNAGFTQFVLETKTVGQALQQNIGTALNGVASGLAKTIVEGKNFGVEMRNLGKQVAESFVEMELKRLMAHMITELGLTQATVAGNAARKADDRLAGAQSIMVSAKSAAAKGWDAGMKFPFPLDFVMAPALAGAAFAGVMAFDSFNDGGIVGHTGMAKVHENEMVLPRPISEKVQKMADNPNAGAKGITVNYSPTVHAVDGKGVGDMLNAHGQQFTNHFMKEMRRRNM